MRKENFIVWIIGVITMLMVMGCSSDQKEEKIDSVEYTVCEESELPKKLVDIIADKKEKEFGLTYNDGDYTYLIKGYGKQDSGGYNIKVDDVYYTENNICLSTTLTGPAENDLVLKAVTYPYIVVKIEHMDKETVFE